ncbi:MAG: 2,3-bisphosphoglycerate-independent phosphoglycerate mutase [bacterium]
MFDEVLERVVKAGDTKMVLVVVDGLGGLPRPETGKTELEEAHKPELDRLAAESALGLIDPISPGVTPGSGPAHLGLFGYDPVKFEIGRGILSALGIGFDVRPSDLTARGNYATLDERGVVADRRAGRISTETNAEISALLDGMKIGSTVAYVRPEKEHRVAVIFRGGTLSDRIADSDPQTVGEKPLRVRPLAAGARATAAMVGAFLTKVAVKIGKRPQANAILLRGFSKRPVLPHFNARFELDACAIASYPMYKGLARLVGMHVVEGLESVEAEVEALERAWADFDFFYFHYKKPDSRGEDSDFRGKVAAIEEFDAHLARIARLSPDVLVVTGDHSTPSVMGGHSWHPVPLLLRSRWVIPDGTAFTERLCARGNLGRMRSVEVLPLMMANARRLDKYGA